MNLKIKTMDDDLTNACRALERAGVSARRLAERTGTPLYVLKAGHIVDLNTPATRRYILRDGDSRKD